MSRFLLIHGAWHGPWCWERVARVLEGLGHRVEAPDLDGPTLASRIDQVAELLSSTTEPAILAGHSMGGMVVTQVAELNPGQIVCLVYVAAYLPASGQRLMDLAVRDGDSKLVRGVRLSDEGTLPAPGLELARAAFYNDCTPEDAARAAALLRPEPSSPFLERISVTPERFGTVARLYLRSSRDRAITPALQDRMLRATPCQVRTMDTGHCPFISAPEELAGHLLLAPRIA